MFTAGQSGPAFTAMQTAITITGLSKIREGIFTAAGGAYLLSDIPALRAEFDGRIQRLNTREMKLDTLGIFPLPQNAIPLLKQTAEYDGKKLEISPIFLKSQIPIYADASGTYGYIPAEGAQICRYFYELWTTHEEETSADQHDIVIGGFTILASYAGI
jgi:hypothetical protein